MNAPEAIINLIFFLLIIYIVSWFARKLKTIEETVKSTSRNIEVILEKDNNIED